jgi:hypothetical protein
MVCRTGFLALLIMTATVGTSRADAAAADQCAAGLSTEARAIYDAARPGVAAGGDLTAVITDAARSLVVAGTIGRSDAKTNAQAAGGCLRQF